MRSTTTEHAGGTNTAYLDWDVRWQSSEGRADWIEPEQFVLDTIPLLHERGVTQVVDLGCGVGRHAVALAQAGFSVQGIDASPTAIAEVTRQAEIHDIDLTAIESEMTDLALDTESVDYLLAWNVIYHGNLAVVRRCLSEILRVLAPGGLFQGTMLSKRNTEIASGTRVALDTYVNGERFEKRHPHYYCNAAELIGLLHGFEPLVLHDVEQKREGSFHWSFLVEKTA